MWQYRQNPLTGRWTLIAPWPESEDSKFAEAPLSDSAEAQLSNCQLCDVARTRSPATDTFWIDRTGEWFDASLPERTRSSDHVLMSMAAAGTQELLVETGAHGARFAEFAPERAHLVAKLYRDRLRHRKSDERNRYATLAKCEPSALHLDAHACAKVLGFPFVPTVVRDRISRLQAHLRRAGTCLICDLIRRERLERVRRIRETMRHFAWAAYAPERPFALLLTPKAHHGSFAEASEEDLLDFADMLLDLVRRLEHVTRNGGFEWILYEAPPDLGADFQQFHWHIELAPALLAPASDEFFGSNPWPKELVSAQRMAPEQVAQRLSELW